MTTVKESAPGPFGTQLKSLRDATRDQVSELVDHFQRRLFEDRDGLLQDLAKLSNPDQGKEVA